MTENIHYMWLSGKQFPKYNTINNFRSLLLKDMVIFHFKNEQVFIRPENEKELCAYIGGIIKNLSSV